MTPKAFHKESDPVYSATVSCLILLQSHGGESRLESMFTFPALPDSKYCLPLNFSQALIFKKLFLLAMKWQDKEWNTVTSVFILSILNVTSS